MFAGCMATGCGLPSMLVHRPAAADVDAAITAMWTADIRRTARTGDWILTRSYSLTADMIDLGSEGPPVAHVAIYDAESGTIIEAISPAVREVPLESLIARNHMAIVVRPRGLSDAQARATVARARSAVGAPFDYLGVLGIDTDGRYYCSELVMWAAGIHVPALGTVAPSSLVVYGDVVFASGPRDDPTVELAATLTARRRSMVSAAGL